MKGSGSCCKRKERCFPLRQAHVSARAATASGCCRLLLPTLSHLPAYTTQIMSAGSMPESAKELDVSDSRAVSSCGSERALQMEGTLETGVFANSVS